LVWDEQLSANTGVWNVPASGAKGLGDDAGAEIADLRELSVAYLGGTRWASLAAAGRIERARSSGNRRGRRTVRPPGCAVLMGF
jgi:hypothetical protein